MLQLGTGKITGTFLGTTISVHCYSLDEETKDHNFQDFLVLCSPCCSELSVLSSFGNPSKYCPVQYFYRGLTWLEVNDFLQHFVSWGKKHCLQRNSMCSLMNGAVSVCCFYRTSQTCHCFVLSAVFLSGSSLLQDETRWILFPLGFTETLFTVEVKINCI